MGGSVNIIEQPSVATTIPTTYQTSATIRTETDDLLDASSLFLSSSFAEQHLPLEPSLGSFQALQRSLLLWSPTKAVVNGSDNDKDDASIIIGSNGTKTDKPTTTTTVNRVTTTLTTTTIAIDTRRPSDSSLGSFQEAFPVDTSAEDDDDDHEIGDNDGNGNEDVTLLTSTTATVEQPDTLRTFYHHSPRWWVIVKLLLVLLPPPVELKSHPKDKDGWLP
jgi:hypothetical protein